MTLQERYAQPWRHFHTWNHVERVLRAAQWHYARNNWGEYKYKPLPVPSAVKTAILWHDAVYLPGAADNEEKSAAAYMANEPTYIKRQNGDAFAKWVEGTILATKTHCKRYMGAWGEWCSRNVMLSCDLVSLAAPWDVFCADAENVKREYRYAYDSKLVDEGRLHFYEDMLKRPFIYPHPDFERSHGPRARANMERALCQSASKSFCY